MMYLLYYFTPGMIRISVLQESTMKQVAFRLCDNTGHSREYTAIQSADGGIIVKFGEVRLETPSEKQLAAAAIALQQQVPGLNTAEVIDITDHF
jgi:hypothetical protein